MAESTGLHQPRWLEQRLPPSTQRRLVVLTGARQTGKTTLARGVYGEALRYVSFDDLLLRTDLEEVPASRWAASVGPAILDEAQKAPAVFDKVKHAFDERQLDFSVLLGSSRILLLDRVRESLAGRAFLYDLWPLLLSELAAEAGGDLERPLLSRWLAEGTEALAEEPARRLGGLEERSLAALQHLARWGGMPGLLELSDEDRRLWFRSFQQTYLERDLIDLVRLSDLQPFRKLQRLAMLRTAQLLNYSGLAQDAQIAASTARRYLEYLHLTYQVLLLQPYHENLTSQVVKSPKLFWTDLGLLRGGTERWGELDGGMFETLVVSEIHKWISTAFEPSRLFYYRTRSGLEVDLLIEQDAGLLGVEAKHRERAVPRDLTSLRAVAVALGERWRGGVVVTRGRVLRELDQDLGIWEVPAHRLLS
ncbi:MAG: ATP-binding protein [Acidobacteria bacterium]|nr:MAG: ATP-binding protein [Acidobacteriota bacterium]REK08735.1 MAG: ATP-binding protein [Acidobacteriota bacterium]